MKNISGMSKDYKSLKKESKFNFWINNILIIKNKFIIESIFIKINFLILFNFSIKNYF